MMSVVTIVRGLFYQSRMKDGKSTLEEKNHNIRAVKYLLLH